MDSAIRTTITVDNELAEELNTLKKERFYNKSTAEMIRYLIRMGLEKSKENKTETIG
jgi:metal-responsive CopG/Arc/MetJ family transcriptional regulator